MKNFLSGKMWKKSKTGQIFKAKTYCEKFLLEDGGKSQNRRWKVLSKKTGVKNIMKKLKLLKITVGKLLLKFGITDENILIEKMLWKVLIIGWKAEKWNR